MPSVLDANADAVTKAGRIRKHTCYERAKPSECTLVPIEDQGPPPKHRPPEWPELEWTPVFSPEAKKGLVVIAGIFTTFVVAWVLSKRRNTVAATIPAPAPTAP